MTNILILGSIIAAGLLIGLALLTIMEQF